MLSHEEDKQITVRRADVAKRAGVSPAVVSYVLNGGPRKASPEARERVLKAVRELGYRPNNVARSLRMRRTMTLGLIVPDMSNPFLTELAHSVQKEAFAAGYALMVGDAAEDMAQQAMYIRSFIQRQVDGVIMMPVDDKAGGLEGLVEANVPWVAIGRHVPWRNVPTIIVANRDGAHEATSHLLDHGRTSIACIAGPADVHSATERAAGWRAALGDRGIDVNDDLLVHTSFHRAAGYRAVSELLKQEKLDAVFCASDEQALGVLQALKDLGCRCPEDVAVASFDGVSEGAHVTPGLTTMSQPLGEIGRASVERLIERIDDGNRVAAATVLPLRLIPRGSCGCPDNSEESYRIWRNPPSQGVSDLF